MATRPAEQLTKFAPVAGAGAEARLVAGRCSKCGKRVFPPPEFCPDCAGGLIEPAELPREGRLYTWSVVHAARAGWEVPFVLGYVDLAPDVRVLAHIVGAGPDELAIDMPVKVRGRSPLASATGQEVLAFEFVPITESSAP
jgi:uncharacterized OB-fold protein